MKLQIKQKYLDQIKKGEKIIELRDAHLTLISDETGEKLRVEVVGADVIPIEMISKDLRNSGMFEDRNLIRFLLRIPGR